MARKRNRKRSRPRFRGINLWNAAESIVQANILTQGAFNTNPLEFGIGWTTAGYGNRHLHVSNMGGNKIGLGELIWDGDGRTAAQERAVAWNNIKNNWVPMIVCQLPLEPVLKSQKA